MYNPLFEIWKKSRKNRNCVSFDFHDRQTAVRNFSWAIPNEEAIRKIAAFSPIVEMGAGSGYWARLLKKAGADITPFDKHGSSTKRNPFVYKMHMRVHRGNSKVLRKRKFKNHALMLCWAPYDDPMAYECLKEFRGSIVVMIGEGRYGCTGDDNCWEYLDKYFKEVKDINIPQWSGIHDDVQIYKRKV
jgi:hypothetical protein